MQSVKEVFDLKLLLRDDSCGNSAKIVLVLQKDPRCAISHDSVDFVVHELFGELVRYVICPLQVFSVLVIEALEWYDRL